MSKLKVIAVMLFCICFMPMSAMAGDFDGSKTLLFSVIDVIECTPTDGCGEVTAESIALPQFLKIDFKKKIVTPAQKIEGRTGTLIERMERVDGKLILQGAEDGIEDVRDGLGWTLAIAEDTGKAVLTGSGHEVAFVIFGACTPL
jgi:hypothetical protein